MHIRSVTQDVSTICWCALVGLFMYLFWLIVITDNHRNYLIHLLLSLDIDDKTIYKDRDLAVYPDRFSHYEYERPSLGHFSA